MGTFTVSQNFVDSVVPSGNIDGINQVYTLPDIPQPLSSLDFYINGLLLVQDIDYSLVGNTITLNYLIPNPGDILIAFYRLIGAATNVNQVCVSDLEIPVGIIDGVNTLFTLSVVPNPPQSLLLAVNGVVQSPNNNPLSGVPDFTLNGNTVIFTNPPAIGSLVVAGYRYYQVFTTCRSTSIMKSDLLSYIRDYLNDPTVLTNGVVKPVNLWSDTYLLRLISRAEIDITQRLEIYWAKFPLTLITGVATYYMPANLKSITRMTYKSVPVEMLTQKQLAFLSPVYRTQQSRVRYATLQFEGMYVLRLFCTPYENLPAISDQLSIYTDLNIMNEFQISGYFYSTESNPYFIVPDWMCRLAVRYFVCWKAFSVEGDGQDIKVAEYYKAKYEQQIIKNKSYLDKIYAAEEKQLQPGPCKMTRIHRPVLPSNYGPIVR